MAHNFKKAFKDGIKLIINCNASPTTIIMQLSKKQVFTVLDKLIPDEEKEES